MAALASLADFVRLGLPAGALVPAPRPIETIDATLDRIVASGHGLLDGDELRLGGAGVLPVPVSAADRYGVSIVDLDAFQLVYLSGVLVGQIVDLTSAGTKPIEYRVDPRPAISRAIEAASAQVQDKATAHSEIVTPTDEVIEVVCVLAAGILTSANRLRLPLNEKQLDELQTRLGYAHARLKKWESGKPIAGLIDVTPTVAEVGAVAGLVTAPNGNPSQWGWGCGI